MMHGQKNIKLCILYYIIIIIINITNCFASNGTKYCTSSWKNITDGDLPMQKLSLVSQFHTHIILMVISTVYNTAQHSCSQFCYNTILVHNSRHRVTEGRIIKIRELMKETGLGLECGINNIGRLIHVISVVSVVCCQVEVSATDWSLVQRSPTECGVSLCVIKKPRKRGG